MASLKVSRNSNGDNLQVVHRGRLLEGHYNVSYVLFISLFHSSYSFPMESRRVGRMSWLHKALFSIVILRLEKMPRNIFPTES